jgi:hypothetical protein
MNEAETRAEIIDPKLQVSGWGTVPESLRRPLRGGVEMIIFPIPFC